MPRERQLKLILNFSYHVGYLMLNYIFIICKWFYIMYLEIKIHQVPNVRKKPFNTWYGNTIGQMILASTLQEVDAKVEQSIWKFKCIPSIVPRHKNRVTLQSLFRRRANLIYQHCNLPLPRRQSPSNNVIQMAVHCTNNLLDKEFR